MRYSTFPEPLRGMTEGGGPNHRSNKKLSSQSSGVPVVFNRIVSEKGLNMKAAVAI